MLTDKEKLSVQQYIDKGVKENSYVTAKFHCYIDENSFISGMDSSFMVDNADELLMEVEESKERYLEDYVKVKLVKLVVCIYFLIG